MTEIESLQIYQKYLDLIYYTNMIIKKFPKAERFSLVADIKKVTYEGLELVIYCYKSYDLKDKIQYLNELDVKLKTLKVLVRVSYKSKYLTGGNYEAWSRKILNVSSLMGGWMKACRKR